MIKRFSVITAFLLLSIHTERCMAASSLFDRLYDESQQSLVKVYPSGELATYVIDEMKRWHDKGIPLTKNDLKAAVDGNLTALCNGKVDHNGVAILFAPGGATEDASCISFKNAIVALVDSEREALLLGNDLTAITSGAELSIADEGNRPVSIPRIAQLLYRLWSGTGASITPWDDAHDAALQAVGTAFSTTSDPARALQRFQHGYFRDQREQNTVYSGIGNDVGTKLQDLANALGVTGDQSRTGEWTVPSLKDAPDIGVWIRGDDLGLYQLYPTQYTSPKLERARTLFPTMQTADGAALAHPFRYDGTQQGVSRKSPLCSRFIGQHGYLCRPFTTSQIGRAHV